MCEALRVYRKKRRLSIAAMARELDEGRETVRTWLNDALPRPEKIVKIYHWSKHEVQPNHFYDLTDPVPLNGLPLFDAGSGKPNGNHFTSKGT